jgi:Fic-DOC domain mobile mystery protein B
MGKHLLDEEEKEGLLIETITTRSELDEFEQQNIEDAMQWIAGRSFKTETVFTEQFVKKLHKKMYGHVWKWAGKFRKSNKNIGVDKWHIPVALKGLLDDTLYWIENSTFSHDEIAIRFKHRLVAIHCFPNGNGRHSRLFADLIIEKIFNKPVFTWGTEGLIHAGKTRSNYITAIKEADKGNYFPLLAFARS